MNNRCRFSSSRRTSIAFRMMRQEKCHREKQWKSNNFLPTQNRIWDHTNTANTTMTQTKLDSCLKCDMYVHPAFCRSTEIQKIHTNRSKWQQWQSKRGNRIAKRWPKIFGMKWVANKSRSVKSELLILVRLIHALWVIFVLRFASFYLLNYFIYFFL